MRKLVWFSCGAASAVAAKVTAAKYPDAEFLYCDTLAFEHPDNMRFLSDVSTWLNKPIKILKSHKYTDIYDVFDTEGWLIGPKGAKCTQKLKREVRTRYQRPDDVHVLGFTRDEYDRCLTFEENNPDMIVEWVLVDANITKDDCYQILQHARIELPTMYKMGYNNNNCIGCVKGGQGYWNKIRVDFPDAFDKMARQERKMNVAINKTYKGDGKRKRVFLDELDPSAGHDVPLPNIECGVICMSDPEDRATAQDHVNQRLKS